MLPVSCFQVTVNHAKVEHKSLPRLSSGGEHQMAPLLLWNIPIIGQSDRSIPDDVGYVHYIFFSMDNISQSNDKANSQSSQSESRTPCVEHGGGVPPWTCPIRIKSSKSGTRQNVAVPCTDPETGLFQTRMYSLTSMDRHGMTYMVLEKDSSPSMQLHNNCDFPVHFGQMLADDNFPGQFNVRYFESGRQKQKGLNKCDWVGSALS